MKKMKEKIIISGKELVISSSGKQGRHLDIVKSGCGAHESKKEKCKKEREDMHSVSRKTLKVILGTLFYSFKAPKKVFKSIILGGERHDEYKGF